MMKRIKIKKIKKEQIMSFLFPVFMLLSAYIVPGTNNTVLALVLMSLVGGVYILRNSIKIIGNLKVILLFTTYIIINQLLLASIHSSNMDIILKTLFFNTLPSIFVIFIYANVVEYTYLIKIYRFIGWISLIGLLYQSLLIYVFHQPTTMIILPFFEKLIPEGTMNYITYWYSMVRPSSFFPEPAYYCNVILPLVIWSLKEKQYFVAIIHSIGILLTTSTLGLAALVIIWSYWAFIYVKKKILKFFFSTLLILSGIVIIQLNAFTETINKALNTNIFANERTVSSYYIYTQIDFQDKILGIGNGNVENYIVKNGIDMSKVEVTVDGYASSGIGNFIYYGIIGGIIYLWLCYNMIRKSKEWLFLFSIIILIFSFVQHMSFDLIGSWWFVLYFVEEKQINRVRE